MLHELLKHKTGDTRFIFRVLTAIRGMYGYVFVSIYVYYILYAFGYTF